MTHAFDRYAGFTDLQALLDYSARPLRKSIRINTLKTTVEAFKAYATGKGWTLTDVPWSKEAFYIERENREDALGKDLMHLIGHFYMQEAASMLPVELLQPEPGEVILDMSAAPGSKTTQIGAKIHWRGLPAVAEKGKIAHLRDGFGGQPSAKAGMVLANDVQEKRLWTLKSSLHRNGVINNIVTKKVGQWFGKHMTERFDRVLCDAPCSAQGTVRKDSDALNYCSIENIEKMARVQFQLLEAAVHAAKVGGRIVYSTCTLTPEENEGLVASMLERFAGKLEVVDPRSLDIAPDAFWDPAIAESLKVQESLKHNSQFLILNSPLLRLWPQTYDTEGFFCAVLKKTASTRDVIPMDRVEFQEQLLSRKQTQEIAGHVENRYGTSFLREHDRLYRRGENLIITTDAVTAFPVPVENYALGIPYGKVLKDGRVLVDHELVTLRGNEATESFIEVDEDQLKLLLDAKDAECQPDLRGHLIMRYEGIPFGIGLAKDGKLKNNLPRWMVRFG